MVISTTDIQLYEILRQKLGEKEAEALVNFVDTKLKENNGQNLRIVATKEDLANAKQELAVAIAKSEARLTVRMFYFWMGQVAVIAGLLAYFFKIKG
jgi:hypothetical protein